MNNSVVPLPSMTFTGTKGRRRHRLFMRKTEISKPTLPPAGVLSLFVLIAAFSLSACRAEKHPLRNEGMPEWCRVYFTPRDPVPERMISLIDSARKRIFCAFYSFTLDPVAEALLDAHRRGVEIRLIMDDSSAEAVDSPAARFRHLGLLKTDLAPGDFMHNKFMVIDGMITWTGSYNPGATGTYRDNNNILVISSAEVAANFEEEFNEMWEGKFGSSSPGPTRNPRVRLDRVLVENYFAPEDPCAGRLIEAIRGAKESIHFALFCFTLDPVAEALIRRQNDGIEIRGVMERGQNSPWSCFRMLDDAGIEVRWDNNLYYLHHKFFVIDGKTVFTGSFNPTRHARTANDENLIVIHHRAVARKYLKEFDRLWERKWE